MKEKKKRGKCWSAHVHKSVPERNLRENQGLFLITAECLCVLLFSEEVDVNYTTTFCDAPAGNKSLQSLKSLLI